MLTRRAFLGLSLTAAGWPRTAAAATTTELLFTITRSKNANVVHYVARLSAGALQKASPIDAYWSMLAEDGRREPLSWAERKLAYGFAVSDVSADACTLGLLAFKTRPIRVERSGGMFRAFSTIGGRRAVLKRIFVQMDESAMLPNVRHLDVFGAGFDGAPVTERILRR